MEFIAKTMIYKKMYFSNIGSNVSIFSLNIHGHILLGYSRKFIDTWYQKFLNFSPEHTV